MLFFSNTKINLGLKILGKRGDGYHDIQSVFYPVPFGDAIEFVPSKNGITSINNHGIQIPGESNENLILKAYHLLERDFELAPIEIHILKNVPTGSGIGGGSSDGAWMIKALNQYYGLDLSILHQEKYALELGSDCPFFIENKPKLVEGRGEILKPIELDLSGFFLVMIKPDIHISTGESYQNIDIPVVAQFDLSNLSNKNLNLWKQDVKNDFEPYAFKKYPVLEKVKNLMYNNDAVYASMSGTGSTVYGIFNEKPSDELLSHKELIWSGSL